MIKNLYNVLGVSENCSYDEIRGAYKALAKKHHPDIEASNGDHFREINEAYIVLIDPILRGEHDYDLHAEEWLAEEKVISKSKTRKNTVKRNKSKTKTEDDLYYTDPKAEPLFYILNTFRKFRFETAATAIWERNLLAIFGCWFVYFIACIGIILKHLGVKFNTTKHRFAWVNHWRRLVAENRFIVTSTWADTLFLVGAIKFIYVLLYSVYWTFKNIFRYFLLPIAILIAVILRFLLGGGFKK